MNKIFNMLKTLKDNASANYSNYKVACIIDTEIGLINGVNVESCVYPLSVCAERNAIANAISNGAKDLNKLYLLTDDSNGQFGMPCGACRQVILEYLPNKEIFVFNNNGEYKTFNSNDLLPFAWSEENLRNRR